MLNFDQDDLDPITGLPSSGGSSVPTPPAPAPVADQSAPPPQAPPPMDPGIKDYLMKKFNLGDYSDENRNKLVAQNQPTIADKGQAALAALGAGFMGKDAGAAGSAVLQRQKAARDEKLQNFDQGRANKIQDYTLNQKMTKDALENEKSDPNSRQSQVLQATVRKLYGKNIPDDQINNLTAADADLILKPLELKAKLDEAAGKRQDSQNARADKLSKKSDDDYDKYVQSAEKQAATLRGDDAAKLSSAKLSAIASGRALLKEYQGREDEMTPDQLAILAADRVKAVTGGIPSNEEMKHMMPSNLGTTFAGMKSYFTGSPSAANSGGWVKEAAHDFDAQEKAARDILVNRQNQITSNPRLRPEDRDRISKMAVPPEASTPKSIVKTQTNQKTGEKRIVYSDGSTEIMPGNMAGQ